MLIDISSTTFPALNPSKKRRRGVSRYFSSSRALQRSRMTKNKKTMSKTNDSTSESLRRALRFGRGEGGQAEDVYVVNLVALEPIAEDIAVVSDLLQPAQISNVRAILFPIA